MSSVVKSDIAAVAILAFDFLVSGPAREYPLWTVRSSWFRSSLNAAFWAGVISAVALPVWVGFRLFREPTGRVLKFVEFAGALCWIGAVWHGFISNFPVI